MEGERQKVKCVSVDFQAEPTILVPQTDCHLTTGASRLQHHLDSKQEQELLSTSICPFLSLPPPVAQKKPMQNHLAGSAFSLVIISQSCTSILPRLVTWKVWQPRSINPQRVEITNSKTGAQGKSPAVPQIIKHSVTT